jgi:hypothetical protein
VERTKDTDKNRKEVERFCLLLAYRAAIELLSMWGSIMRAMTYPEVVIAVEKEMACFLGARARSTGYLRYLRFLFWLHHGHLFSL